MNPFFSIICLVGIPILVINRQYKILFVLAMMSVMANDFYVQIFGSSRLLLASYISLIVFPFITPFFVSELKKKQFSVPRAFFIEYVLLISLAVYFNFISPLEGSDQTISFNTGVAGRSILGSIRIFSDLALMVFIVFLFKKNIINLNFFGKTIFLIAAIHIPIAIFDFFFHYPIKNIFISHIYETNRPHGFCHEPKGLGRLTFGAFLFFFSFFLAKKKTPSIPRIALPVLLLGVLISFSASTYLAGLVTIIGMVVFMARLKDIGTIIFLTLLGGIAFYFIFQSDIFQTNILRKIDFAVGFITRDKRIDEPAIFTLLESFDRAAVYFFIKNPSYMWLGTGPNLVSIPATNYMSDYYSSFIERVDGLPQTVIYYFSRSGFVGLLILGNIFSHLRKRIKKIDYKPLLYLLYGVFIFTFINNQIWFMIYIGMISGVIYQIETTSKIT